jgi:hypothetical protein
LWPALVRLGTAGELAADSLDAAMHEGDLARDELHARDVGIVVERRQRAKDRLPLGCATSCSGSGRRRSLRLGTGPGAVASTTPGRRTNARPVIAG